jgi:hypothetical protein
MSQVMIPQHQLKNATLYSTRYDFIKTLPKGITFLEAGVLAGDFAMRVIEECLPSKSILIDPYKTIDWHAPEYGGKRWDGPDQHFNFVKERFSNMPNVKIFKGKYETFSITNKETFDFLYMDYETSYESIQSQIEISKSKLNPNGILGFNDYNIYENETKTGQKMGVVPAINEFLYDNPEWYVHAFALNDNLTSDIYLKKLI